MVISGTRPQAGKATPDPSLIKLVCKAHKLRQKLMTGEVGIRGVARSEGVHRSYVSRLIRPAYLSPGITEAILDGRQPPDLTAAKLMRVSALPLDWRAQREALRFK